MDLEVHFKGDLTVSGEYTRVVTIQVEVLLVILCGTLWDVSRLRGEDLRELGLYGDNPFSVNLSLIRSGWCCRQTSIWVNFDDLGQERRV